MSNIRISWFGLNKFYCFFPYAVGFSPGSGSGVTTGNVSNNSSNRRKSVGHIPLSPLARTPSPSPLPASPTRSPSPLAFPVIVHQPGI